MRYSTIAGAALLAPAAFASPIEQLEARQKAAPTCNPNNVRALGQQKPKSTGFCTNWFKTTTTKHVAPVTVTGLSEAQITNLCNCILAPSYVSGRPLTSLEPTSTAGSSSAAQTSSTTTPAVTSSVASSTTSSSSASATPTGCVNGDTAAAADGSVYTKSCASGLDGAIGSSFTVGGLAACQNRCTTGCAGVVYTAASRSCVLYTEVEGTYDNEGSVALVYKSGRGSASSSTSASSSSSSTSSSSSSAVSSSTGIPSAFNVYIATSASATASGSILRSIVSTTQVGVYPSPTAAVQKRDNEFCTTGDYSSNGNNFYRACGQEFVSGGTVSVALDPTEQPDADDKISTLTGCIDFCAKKGVDSTSTTTPKKQKCKAVQFVEANAGAFTGCKLYGSADVTPTTSTTATTGQRAKAGTDVAYLISEVPAGVFTFDRRTGYLFTNDTTGHVLCANPADGAEISTSTTTPKEKVSYAGDIFSNAISAATCIPLVCEIDSASRLTCLYESGNIKYGKPFLTPVSNKDTTDTTGAKLIPQTLRFQPGSGGDISMYIAPAQAATTADSSVTNGAAKTLLSTPDFVNSAATFTDKQASFTQSGSNIALSFDIASGSSTKADTASVTLTKDVFVYSGDVFRFTGTVSLDRGVLVSDVDCKVSFGFDSLTTPAYSVTLDSTFPGSFDLLYEGKSTITKTTAVKVDITCKVDANSYTIPMTLSSFQLVANPAAPLRSNVEFIGSATDYKNNQKAYVQYYKGSGTLIPTGPTAAGGNGKPLITDNTATTPLNLYVGDVSAQASAISACAQLAGADTTTGNFEVYFDTSANNWFCVRFAKTYASKSLFGANFAFAAASANPVFGYYLSNQIAYQA